MHMEQIQKHQASVKTEFANVRPYIENMSQEIARTFDRIEARERHINQQLEGLLNQYRSQQDNLAEATEKYR